MPLLLALLLVLFPLARPTAQEPQFASGELGDLSCKLVKQVTEKSGTVRLQVEVSNAAKHAAEPLEFRLRQVPRKPSKQSQEPTEILCARACPPLANRYGRPVPPKGKARYWLQASALDSGALDLELEVTQASWFDGSGVSQPAIAIGKPTQLEQTSLDGRPLEVSQVHLVNPLRVAVDALFLATTKEPHDEQVLLGVRLPPGSLDWVISEVDSRTPFEQDVPTRTVRVVKLELVDWCLVGAGDAAAAALELESAYRGWVQWSEPYPALGGRLNYSFRTSDGIDRVASGRFALDSAGVARIEFEPSANPDLDATALRSMTKDAALQVANAFADLRRESWDQVCANNRLSLFAQGVVELDGAGFAPSGSPLDRSANAKQDPRQTQNLSVVGGRIAADGDRGNPVRQRWTSLPFAAGYVVTQRRTEAGDWCYQFSYGLLDGCVVPTAYREYWGTVTGTVLHEHLLTFSDLRFESEVAPSAPPAARGPGAAALRAAWDSGYRYPQQVRDLSAKFEVRTPGNDLSWQSQRELNGTVKLAGFRGFMMGSGSWLGYAADCSTPLSAGQNRSLGFVLFDRLVLWSGRDFNGRPDFDEQFSDCEIAAPTSEGRFQVEGGMFESLLVRDGRVASLTFANGLERRFTWTKVGESMVVTRVRTGEEDLVAKFSKVDGLLLPVEFELNAVFGPDWGPEKIRLREVELH